MKFVYVTAVWGDYVQPWVETCLPLQLGQLRRERPEPGMGGDLFVVCTDQHNHASIKSHLDEALKQTMQPQVVVFGGTIGNSHEAMTEMHKHVINAVAGPDTCLVFLSPDVLYSCSSFEFARQQILGGKRAVMAPMFRCLKEEMVEAIKIETGDWGGDLSKHGVGPRLLLNMAFEHLHGMTDALFWDAPLFYSNWPSNLYFRTAYGIRGNCFHVHPFAVVLDKPVVPKGALDADLLLKSGIAKEDIYVVSDSDDFCGIELSSSAQHIPWPGEEPRSIEGIGRWGQMYATEMDRWFFGHAMRWHTEDLPRNVDSNEIAVRGWERVLENEAMIDHIVAQIARLSVPEPAPDWSKYKVKT